MRTTIELPDDLMRRVKAAAALRGMKLKEFVADLLEAGVRSPRGGSGKRSRRLPVMIEPAGRNIPIRSNAELFEILEEGAGNS